VFRWGYGHFPLFAALGALGAGLQVVTEASLHEIEISSTGAAFTVGIPVAVSLTVIGALHAWLERSVAIARRFGACAVLVLAAASAASMLPLPLAIVVMGMLVCGLAFVEVRRAPALAPHGA
jgi:low temperature requirement protein LtrA